MESPVEHKETPTGASSSDPQRPGFTVFWYFSDTQGGELVYAGIADLLWGGRAIQPEELLGVIVCVLHSGCADGVLDGKEDGRPQKEGWLPHSLGGIDGLLVGAVTEQGHSELGGDAAEGRDLVGAGAAGVQDPVWGVVQLLQSEEAKALDKRPFHLSNIDGGIQTGANIHDNVCAEVLMISC